MQNCFKFLSMGTFIRVYPITTVLSHKNEKFHNKNLNCTVYIILI